MARIVIKLGTSVLVGESGDLDRAHLQRLADECAHLVEAGHEIVICSSGAITVGRQRLGLAPAQRKLPERQMLAAVGQPRLMKAWEQCFDIHGIPVGQMLLTRADVEDRGRYLNARDAIQAMLEHGVIPIANENDAVATEEIQLGDNDTLSALLAMLIGADLLVILTDQQGLFTADPRIDPKAQLIEDVGRVDSAIRSAAGQSSSGVGTGGMKTKLRAAEIAGRAGTAVVLASGRVPNVILRAVAGESVGTRFVPTATPLEHRKRWILAGPATAAYLVVDQGAANALRESGRSLLPAGIVRVVGSFFRGDTIAIQLASSRTDGADAGPPREIGRGIVQYDSAELEKIRGQRSGAINEILGHSRGAVAIHRNDLVLEA